MSANIFANKEEAMNTHPYLRAYLAGAFVPTLVLPLLLRRVYRGADRAEGAGSHRAGD
jgi:hypothetical protein